MFLLETERLGLRLLEPSDLEAIMTFWGDVEVMRYCGGPGTHERELRAVGYYAELQQRSGLSVCISYARGVQSIKRLVASIDPRNVISGKILEKLGFSYEGLKWCEDLKQNEPFYVMRLE